MDTIIDGEVVFGIPTRPRPGKKGEYIWRPKTARWVKRYGEIGRQIAIEQKRQTALKIDAKVKKKHALARERDFQRREIQRKNEREKLKARKAARIEYDRQRQAHKLASEAKIRELKQRDQQRIANRLYERLLTNRDRNDFLSEVSYERQLLAEKQQEQQLLAQADTPENAAQLDDIAEQTAETVENRLEDMSSSYDEAFVEELDTVRADYYEDVMAEIRSPEEPTPRLESTPEEPTPRLESIPEGSLLDDVPEKLLAIPEKSIVATVTGALGSEVARTAERVVIGAIATAVLPHITQGASALVPRVTEVLNTGYEYLPDVSQTVTLSVLIIEKLTSGFSGLAAALGPLGCTILGIGCGIAGIYHLIEHINGLDASEKLLKRLLLEQDDTIKKWEIESGQTIESYIRNEWKLLNEEQRVEYLKIRDAALKEYWANLDESDKADLKRITGEDPPSIPLEATSEEPEKTAKADVPEKSDVPTSPEEDADKEKPPGDPKKSKLRPPNYIAPALIIAAAIAAVDKLFRNMLVPLALLHIFRNEFAKMLAGVVSTRLTKENKTKKK